MTTRMRPRWKIRTLVVLTTIVASIAAWSAYVYSQHYAIVLRISESGGEIDFAHQNPGPSTYEVPVARVRGKEMPSGDIRMVPVPAYIPICTIRTNDLNPAPKPGVFYQAMRYLSGNNDGNEKTWSLFDFENDWSVAHVNLPITAFDDRMMDYLLSLPDLKYVTVSGMRDVKATFGDLKPDPDELERLRQISDLLSSVEVHSKFKQWLKDDVIVYR